MVPTGKKEEESQSKNYLGGWHLWNDGKNGTYGKEKIEKIEKTTDRRH